MANLKDIKTRIGSVKNTQQITRAMKLVAAAKLRRAQEAVINARPYATRVKMVMESISKRAAGDNHPLLKRRPVKNVMILIMSGDKGLCGPFNTNVFKSAQKVIADNEGHNVSLMIIGKKGGDFFEKRPYPITKQFLDYGKNLNSEYARTISNAVTKSFSDETVDQVYLVYNRFKNVVVQETQIVPLLPAALVAEKADSGEGESRDPGLVDYDYEPSPEELLGDLLKMYVENQIFQGLLESSASENGARMTAMDAATRNAKEMIESLTLEYNKARQAAITTELIEVVSGADALAG